MSKRNRNTLKHYFREGALPTVAHFEDLIDSSVNILEEGIYKTPKDGWQVASLAKQDQLISFYQGSVDNRPRWSIGFSQDASALLFNQCEGGYQGKAVKRQTVLSLNEGGQVGVNHDAPQVPLDVKGVIRSTGRIGSTFTGDKEAEKIDSQVLEASALSVDETIPTKIPADGKWHRITPILEGCHGFEITAGVGVRWSGNYALLRATALNTCDPRGWFAWLYRFFPSLNRQSPIHCQQAYYLSRADKLKLKWVEVKPSKTGQSTQKQVRQYYLAIASNRAYEPKAYISYQISQLWFDQYMRASEFVEAGEDDSSNG